MRRDSSAASHPQSFDSQHKMNSTSERLSLKSSVYWEVTVWLYSGWVVLRWQGRAVEADRGGGGGLFLAVLGSGGGGGGRAGALRRQQRGLEGAGSGTLARGEHLAGEMVKGVMSFWGGTSPSVRTWRTNTRSQWCSVCRCEFGCWPNAALKGLVHIFQVSLGTILTRPYLHLDRFWLLLLLSIKKSVLNMVSMWVMEDNIHSPHLCKHE